LAIYVLFDNSMRRWFFNQNFKISDATFFKYGCIYTLIHRLDISNLNKVELVILGRTGTFILIVLQDITVSFVGSI
jgi:hypothetical protein